MTVDGLKIRGFLKFDDEVARVVLSVGWLLVEKGGVLQIGSPQSPIGKYPGVKATIYIKREAINRHPVYGDRFLHGDGGTIEMFGKPLGRTWTLLSRSVAEGARELFLKHSPSDMGWSIGDQVGVATTSRGESTKHRIVDIRPATEELVPIVATRAGAEESHLPAAHAADGNLASLWSSYLGGQEDHWLQMDLASVTFVTHVRFYFQEPRHAPEYQVEVKTSPNGSWWTAANVSDGKGGWQEVPLNVDHVHSIRMFAVYSSMWNRGYKGNPGAEPAWSGLWMKEVEIYGRKVGGVMPTVVVLDTPVMSNHMGGFTEVEGHMFEAAAEVVNLERSILITGEHDDFYESLEGFSTAMMGSGIIDVRYTRLEYCGRRDKMGKYCLHFHMVGTCPKCVFQGNAVVDSQQVGITIHGTHRALVDQNTLWDARAAGIYTEDGNEMNNVISNNVVICSRWQVCAVSWLGKNSLQGGGIYMIGMTNDVLYNRIAGYEHGLYTPGSAFPRGQGYAWGRVCPQFTPFGAIRGNVNHDNERYGLYLDNQYPRNLDRDKNGFVRGGCPEFTTDGKDNGVVPANVVEDEFDYHNIFVGVYSLGDVSFVRYVSLNNAHSFYWKTSKNFADGVSHHFKDGLIANNDKDAYGRLQVLGPSGPFTFRFTNMTFAGGPVGEAALCAGQHCGRGGAGGPCNVQYLLEDVDWAHLMAWQKRIKFGAHALSFGFVQPIFLAADNTSLGGYRAMVSQHLNGFAAVGCEQQDFHWDSGFACNLPIRRLNFWSNVDQGNLTLSGPGYYSEPNLAYPSEGLNAGLMQYEPMHKGYGLPVVAGQNYTVSGTWSGDVAVEFSDRIVTEVLRTEPERLSLAVLNGTTCDLTSEDPRDYLSPLGTSGQAETVQLEEKLNCMIKGAGRSSPTSAMTPTGRQEGECEFPTEPAVAYHWDPSCFFGRLGCLADGINPECGYCGTPPFPACITTTTKSGKSAKSAAVTTTSSTTTSTTTTSTTTTSTTTMFADKTIKNLLGQCLAASADMNGEAVVRADSCNLANLSQQWVYDEVGGTIRNLLCLHSGLNGTVQLQACVPMMDWTHNNATGQIHKRSGNDTCLEASSTGTVLMADCRLGLKGQVWSIGSGWLPSLPAAMEEASRKLSARALRASTTAAESATTTSPTTTVPPTTMAPPTTTTLADMSIKSFLGRCLEAPHGAKKDGSVRMVDCNAASSAQQWVYVVEAGVIRNELCLHVSSEQVVSMQPCGQGDASPWSFHAATGQIQTPLGTCLQAPLPTTSGSNVVAVECDAGSQLQIWSIGGWKLPGTTANTTMEPMTATTVTWPQTTSAQPPTPTTAISADAWTPSFDETVRDWSGRCLAAVSGSENGGYLQLQPCEQGDEAQRWVQEKNALRNEICLDSPHDGEVHMWSCYYHEAQIWAYDPSTGLLRQKRGKCLEAPCESNTSIHLSTCDLHNERQRWSIGGVVPPASASGSGVTSSAWLRKVGAGRAALSAVCAAGKCSGNAGSPFTKECLYSCLLAGALVCAVEPNLARFP
eukprot:CAMPEP_0115286310 /NCGR_PEP_ID=MMETSP0270-20121206/61878_1 /TAXON_ID=71861 /ORGANISM="Scrippsiella trochoidea, Strain CCMP3099" /LENGTH=1525 /DNA_ID=CAMNT_0002703355 /DNA_START=436 /DNA_END=5010 /DNA_ORIENTATION=+